MHLNATDRPAMLQVNSMPSPVSASSFSQLTIPYPKNRVELAQWFGSEEGCLKYLDSLRWAEGFVCGSSLL